MVITNLLPVKLKEKEICASSAVGIQNAKVMVTVFKCLVKMKKT